MLSFVRWFVRACFSVVMLSFVRWFVRVCFLAMLFLLPACASSCSCDSAEEVPPTRALLPCKARGKSVTIAPPLTNRVIVPGSIPQSFGVDAVGNAVASLSLTVAPYRMLRTVMGDDGAWLELGASVVGLFPGGDIAKTAVKGATKAAKATAKVGAEVVDDVGKVVKGSRTI